jgi:uncharacterized protein (TIGR03435 family)
MTTMQRRLYAVMIRLHPADFRNRFGLEMLLDFEDACGTHHSASLYLDAARSLIRQWISHLFFPAPGPQPAQASLLSGQYVSLAQPGPGPFELLRASCVAALLFFSIGFTTTPRPGVEQMSNAAVHSSSASSAAPSVPHSDYKVRHAGTVASANATFRSEASPVSAEPDTTAAYTLDLFLAATYIYMLFLCVYFMLGGYFHKHRALRSILVTAIAFSCTAPMHAKALNAAMSLSPVEAVHTQQAALRFDVVTVKLSDPAKEHLALYWRQPDGLKWDGVTLRGMIASAYGVSSIVRYQIEGGPDWMGSRAFDIHGKVDDETTARWSRMTQREVDEELDSMERALLAERFRLKFHRETREMPALVLTVAKGGMKLQPPQPEHNLQAGVPTSRINFFSHGHWEGHSALMSNLARSLGSQPEIAGRPVVDKTGLTGGYDFTLRWTPDDPSSAPASADTNAQWPSLFTALKEQLGLMLIAKKQPIDIIVVDSVEMPSEN